MEPIILLLLVVDLYLSLNLLLGSVRERGYATESDVPATEGNQERGTEKQDTIPILMIAKEKETVT